MRATSGPSAQAGPRPPGAAAATVPYAPPGAQYRVLSAECRGNDSPLRTRHSALGTRLLVLGELLLVGDGEGVAALAAAGGEDCPAGAGAHPLQESVLALAGDPLRLIRPLHD